VLGFATDRRLALSYLGAIGAGIVALRLVAWAIMAGVARLPSPKNPALRMAMRNLHRPQAPTPAIVLSLGLGLSLLVSLAMIDAAITRQLTQNLPEKAPDFFFLDIPRSEQQAFADTVSSIAPNANIEMVPMLRGRITAINDIKAEDYNAIPEARWLLEGERGLTYTANLPEGTKITQGQWWDADTPENLVSFDDELGAELGLKLGDTLTVNVLGREVTAKLVNFRAQEWENLSITFVMQFSPATFKGAPHMVLSTVSLEENAANQDEVLRAVVKAIPTITAIPVRDALEFANGIVKRLASALRGASSVTLVTSILVLSGAFAAGYRARAYDAMVMKTLGATRRTLLGTLALEYVFLGLIASVFGLFAGMTSAWAILTFVMETPFVFAWALAIGLALGALLVTLSVGLLATLSVLKQRPAQALRNL
jgi:putative ABC transport system permease protein